MKRTYPGLLAVLIACGAVLCGSAAVAQVAPPLGTVQQFSVLGHSGVTGSAGAGTVISGDVGSSPTATITNFPPSRVNPPSLVHFTNDLAVQQAHADALIVYNNLAAQGPGTVLPAQLNGAVLTSGIYSFLGGAADLAATGTLTLNGPGIFIFQVDSALTANVGSNIVGTADPCNVYWRVGTSATLNGVTFRGNVFADASITIGAGANVSGRVIAGTGATGAVTMAGAGGNTIGGCAAATVCPAITVDPATLPNPALGTPYSATVTASGGVGPYTFAVTSGALPQGLVINGNTGAITGTPTSPGNSGFTITATDSSSGCFGSRAYTVGSNSTTAVPAVGSTGMIVMMVLLMGAGLIVMSKFGR